MDLSDVPDSPGKTEKFQREILDAETVYVVMGNNYRISRNRRAEWFFSKVNTVINVVPDLDLNHLQDELTIVSVIPKNPVAEWRPETMTIYSYRINSETNINFLALKYRLVFCLDISPSVASVDVQAGLVMFDGIYHALQSSLENLVKPFYVPGSLVEFHPRIYLTVIAHTPFLAPVSDQVLIQGIAVTPVNVNQALSFIFERLAAFETKVAEATGRVSEAMENEQAKSNRMLGSMFDDRDRGSADYVVAVSSDFGFVDLLRQAIIALHLLPENSTAGIIVVTDGVISVPDGAFLDVILSQLRYNTVPCSFIQLSSPFHPHLCYGTIPYADFMRFVASATFGTYFTSIPDEPDKASLEMNLCQKAFLSWSFLKVWEELKSSATGINKPGEWSVRNKCFSSVRDMPIVRKQQYETTLAVDYLKVLSCRLREGFTIKEVHFSHDSAEIKLSLPWKFLNNIEYTLITSIPSQSKVLCSVSIEGPYDFLHDLTCLAKKPFESYYRQLMVNRFWTSQKFLSESDKLLVHFNSFSTNPAYYDVPDSLKNGIPLFYMQTSSPVPILSRSEFSSSQSQSSQFAQFWKPVCMLDTSIWQKWMHTHSIRIILEHDYPLPVSLHVPNASGRYQVIQCRQTLMTLNTFLKDWSSFVLVENSSYVKLIFNDTEKPPFSFYVIRVTSKPPCVVLRLAFLVGTPGHLRHEVVMSMREGISQLSCLQRLKDPPHDWKSFNLVPGETKTNQSRNSARSPNKSWQLRCCTVVQKPVEKILIRYERVPRNLLRTLLPQTSYYSLASPKAHALQQSTFGFRPTFHTPWGSTIKMGPEMFNTVARYLHHRRWVWCVQSNTGSPLTLNCASQILSTLEKIRLEEGFQFAYSAAGTATMVMELQMSCNLEHENVQSDDSSVGPELPGETTPCVLQYIVFPPVYSLSSVSEEEDEGESESTEESGELYIASECWIEPQSGTVVPNKQRDCSYMLDTTYDGIPRKIFDTDKECISTLVTFEHLSLMCKDEMVPSPMSLPPTEKIFGLNKGEDIMLVPFAFDLNRILPKSQHAEVLLSMLIQDLGATFPMKLGDRLSAYYDQANTQLYEKLIANMRSVHDREVNLPLDKNADILAMLTATGNCSITWRSPDAESNESNPLTRALKPFSPRLKCFIKKLAVATSHVVLTIVPATYEDVKILMLPKTGVEKLERSGQSGDNSVFFVPDAFDMSGYDEDVVEPTLNSFEDYLDSNTSHQLTSTPVTGMKDGSKASYHVEIGGREAVATLVGRKRSRVKSGGESGPSAKRPLKRATVIDESFRLRAGSMETYWRAKNIVRSRTKSADDKHFLQPAYSGDIQEARSATYGPCETWAKQNGLLSQDSVNECYPLISNHKPNYGSVTVPVFCYDCSLSQVTDQVVKGVIRSDEGIHFDFRVHRQVDDVEDYIDDEPKSIPVEDSDSEKVEEEPIEKMKEKVDRTLGDQGTLKSICGSLETAWKKSYLYGIYESLQKDMFVYPTDIDVAITMCQEFQIEVSLTEFLKTVCCHFNEASKSQGTETKEDIDWTHGRKDNPCKKMSRIHGFVRKRFTNILLGTFNCVNGSSDVFYLRQSSVHGEPHENESSKQTSDYEVESLTVKADSTCSEVPTKDDESRSQVAESEDDDNFDLREHILQTIEESSTRSVDAKTKPMPLFLQLKCSVKTCDREAVCKLRDIPTCIDELFNENSEATGPISRNSSELSINLQFVFLTIPPEVEDIEQELGSRIRTLSTCSTSSAPTPNDEHPPLVNSGCPEHHIIPESMKKYPNIPVFQLQAVKKTVENVQWLLRDEITSCLSDAEAVCENTLNMVASHVQKSLGKPGCQLHTFPLNFVNKACLTGYDKFRERFKSLKIDGFSLQEQNAWFYIVGARRTHKVPCRSNVRDLHGKMNQGFMEEVHDDARKDSDAETTVSTDGDFMQEEGLGIETYINAAAEIFRDEQSKVEGVSSEKIVHTAETKPIRRVLLKTPSQLSEISSAIESAVTNDEAYDGDGSESGMEDANEEVDITHRYRSLPFWLIFRLNSEQIHIFFHCRYNEDDLSVYTYASKLMDKIVNAVTDLRRVVNQDLLLQQLHDTRQCSPLLEPENDETDIWETRETFSLPSPPRGAGAEGLESDYPSRATDSALEFAPGTFSCQTVWETKFVLHSRLRTGPSKSVVSRGIQTLRTTLIAFEVANRKNMFVYRDASGNVFYLRLYRTHGCNSPNFSEIQFSDIYADSSEADSRFSGTTPKDSSGGDIVSGKNQAEDVVLLQVHGIAEAGPEIKEQLVQSLRNKLDDSVLDILSVTLERNPHCKLTPEDVHFIQRPKSQPDSIFKYGVSSFASQLLTAFEYYIHQNVLQFLHLPKYTDTKPENRFLDYSRISDEVEVREKLMYLYNQSPGGTGSRGIACLAINVVDKAGNIINAGGACRPCSDAYKKKVSSSDFPGIVATEELMQDNADHVDTILEVKVWKQGRINIDLLKTYLLTAMKHCLWDLQMEYYFLTAPVLSQAPNKLDTISASEPTTPMVEGMISKHDFYKEGHLSMKYPIIASLKNQSGNLMTGGIVDAKDVMRSSLERRNSANLPPVSDKSEVETPRVRSLSVSARKPIMNLDGKILSRAPSPLTFSQQGGMTGSYKSKHLLEAAYTALGRNELKDFGQLHEAYGTLMKEWCEFGSTLAVPSLRVSSVNLLCRHDPDAVAQEVEKVIQAIAPDNSPRQFWKSYVDGEISGDQYVSGSRKINPREEPDARLRSDAEFKMFKKSLKCLRQFEKQEEVEYPPDLAQLFRTHDDFNPKNPTPECVIISRNLLLWKVCVSNDFSLENLGIPEVPKNCYKFPPLYSGNSELNLIGGSPSSTSLDKLSRVSSNSQLTTNTMESEIPLHHHPVLVPRQRLLLAHITSSQVSFIFYNWSKETSDRIMEQTKCVALWANARSSLFSSIFAQKAGLFTNQSIQSSVPLPSLNPEGNPFVAGVVDTDILIRNRGPPKEYYLSRLSNLKKTKPVHSLSTFLDCCRNIKHATQLKPPEPNVPHAHGEQLISSKLMDKKDTQNSLFQYWLLRGLSASNMIGYDAIHSYKQAARVIHYVMTPIIFLSRWRSEVAATRDSMIGTLKKGKVADIKKIRMMHKPGENTRSRHGSGASQRSLDSKSRSKSSIWGGLWGNNSPASTSEPLSTHAMNSSATSLISSKKFDEKWHSTLCESFIQEYIQYLQTLGFIPIQSKNVNRQRVPSKKDTEVERNRNYSGASFVSMHSSGSSQSGNSSHGQSSYGNFVRRQREESGEKIVHYLQRSLAGGILLFEIGLTEPFFFAKLYALEAARIQIKKNRKDLHQSTMEFLAECDKIKASMHLHSFTYDFHLRSIHSYLSGRQLIFKQGYHLTNFLLDFIKYYPKGPNFARNIVHVGSVTVQNVATPSHILYNYIVDHEKLYDMKVVRMTLMHPENYNEMVNEFVLTQISSKKVVYVDREDEGQQDEFDLTLLISHDIPPFAKPYSVDPSVLRLKYFIILTSRRELYPKAVQEKTQGKLSIVSVPEALGRQGVPFTGHSSEPASTHGSRRPSISDQMPSALGGITMGPMDREGGNYESTKKIVDKVYEGIFEEQVNYMGYFSSHEQMMQSIMREQVVEVERDILSIVNQASVDCRRDLLWKRLLFGTIIDDRTRNKKEDLNFRETSGALTYWEFSELLDLIAVRSLTEMDSRLTSLLTQPRVFYKNLMELLAIKHKNYHRFYASPDNTSYQMAIYSPKVMNCAVLLDTNVDTADLKIIFKELPAKSESGNPEDPCSMRGNEIELDADILELIESVVNACCYCCWARCVDTNVKI